MLSYFYSFHYGPKFFELLTHLFPLTLFEHLIETLHLLSMAMSILHEVNHEPLLEISPLVTWQRAPTSFDHAFDQGFGSFKVLLVLFVQHEH